MPSEVSAAIARRTVWRLTPKRPASSDSEGRRLPFSKAPLTISAFSVSMICRQTAMPALRSRVLFVVMRSSSNFGTKESTGLFV